MNSPLRPVAVLRDGALAGAQVTGNFDAVLSRCRALGADEGEGALVHLATTTDPRRALDAAWDAIRAGALPPEHTRGLIVLIAPPPGDPHAQATRAGFENLARSLSIEWARHGTR